VSLSSGDEVPHIFTRKSRLQPGEFLISSAKRLLQQYRHLADIKLVVGNICYFLLAGSIFDFICAISLFNLSIADLSAAISAWEAASLACVSRASFDSVC
jgi:hypothetical protein